MEKFTVLLLCVVLFLLRSQVYAQNLPKILSDNSVKKEVYLPDYSYAGYQFSYEEIPNEDLGIEINVPDYGAITNDGFDDTQAVHEALQKANQIVVISSSP